MISQVKTGNRRYGLGPVLAVSALAAGLAFTGSSAQASLTTCTTPGGIMNPSTNCTTTGDPVVAPFTNHATVIATPDNTFVNLEGTGLNWPFAQQQIDTDFNVPLAGNYTGPEVTSIYKVVTDPSTAFNGIDLSASGVGNFTVKKEVFSDETLTTKIAELNLTGSGFVPVVPIPATSQIWIKDTFDNPVIGQSSIDNVQNTLRSCPGPLPLLGAGAAFGFSRKLRGRIKASRTA